MANCRFEVYISNSQRNNLQNVTGKFGSFSGDTFTPTECQAGFLCVTKGRLPLEGYSAAGLKNGSSRNRYCHRLYRRPYGSLRLQYIRCEQGNGGRPRNQYPRQDPRTSAPCRRKRRFYRNNRRRKLQLGQRKLFNPSHKSDSHALRDNRKRQARCRRCRSHRRKCLL